MINTKEQIAELRIGLRELKEKLANLDAIPMELERDLQKLVCEIGSLECVLFEKTDLTIPNF